MNNIPKDVIKRLNFAIPKFQKILSDTKKRDVNEADTVTVIVDILENVFGFNRYTEITKEFEIQGTYCDIAIKSGNKVEYLIEVKAIGKKLNEKHLRQAVNYASREGINWVILTNGVTWQIYRVTLGDKVQNNKVFEFDFTKLNPKDKEQQELLFLLCRKGIQKYLINDYYEHRQYVNRYIVGALLTTDVIVNTVSKELRKFKPGLKINIDEIKSLIEKDVIKRDLIESDERVKAQKQIKRYLTNLKIKKTWKQKKLNELNKQVVV